MIVIGVFEKFKLLDKIVVEILRKNISFRMVLLVLVSLCFVFLMFIINDVVLIFFVFFIMIIVKKVDFNLMKIIILEILVVNIGSSFIFMGNL